MKPGATTCPRASTRCFAEAVRSTPGSVTAAMRSPRIPTSPYIHGLPVPSTMRPFSIITSYAPDAGLGDAIGACRMHADNASEPIATRNTEVSFLQRIKEPYGGSDDLQ